MKVIKRSGEEVIFDVQKIENAIRKANKATSHSQMSEATILKISKQVEAQCKAMKRSPSVEEIQDMVETAIMKEQYLNMMIQALNIMGI